MAELIETSQMQAYLNFLFTVSILRNSNQNGRSKCFAIFKKKKSFFFLFALLPSSLKSTSSLFPSCKNIFHLFYKLFDQI